MANYPQTTTTEFTSNIILTNGGFFGIRTTHTAPHFMRAVMEGVALGMGKDVRLFESLGLSISSLMSVGGGTRNELWNKIKADVLQVPIEISPEPEAGLRGAAILGAAAVGLIDGVGSEARKRRTGSRRVEPDLSNRAAYAEAQKEFDRVYDHMLGFWQ